MITAYAREPHHIAHLQSVISYLDPGLFDGWINFPDEASPLTLVASSRDAKLFRGRSVIYVEHGAGQTYNGDPRGVRIGGYSGSPGLDNVVMFLAPNLTVAERWKATYPNTPVSIVGSPYVADLRDEVAGGPRDSVVLTHHWDCLVCQESMSAFPYFLPKYRGLIEYLHALDIEVLGHGHPRAIDALAPEWKKLGLEVVYDWPEVASRCRLLLCDNSSVMYEAAALDIPVLALNSPEYRHNTHHGLRFWDHVPGFQCSPDDLITWVAGALEDPHHAKWLRARAASAAFATTGESARSLTRRALRWIVATRSESPSATFHPTGIHPVDG